MNTTDYIINGDRVNKAANTDDPNYYKYCINFNNGVCMRFNRLCGLSEGWGHCTCHTEYINLKEVN